VIARDTVASDQLVYAWPFPINGQTEVACGEDEVVVMCPAWTVGEKLGPGHHAWQSPSPDKPTSAYFILTGPVEVPFEVATAFMLPSNGAPIRLRAAGSLLVRCSDPGLLVAQFVGLPFDQVNNGILYSVSQSVSRLLARVLSRRVVMAATPLAVTDPSMLGPIADEVAAYNPTGGAVHGVEFVRFVQLAIQAEDGAWDGQSPPPDWQGQAQMQQQMAHQSQPMAHTVPPGAAPAHGVSSGQTSVASGEIAAPDPPPPGDIHAPVVSGGMSSAAVSGEISPRSTTMPPPSADVPMMPPGTRVLVAGPDGRLHAAMVRQHMAGYYELEIGSTSETVWVPMAQVLPES